MARHTKTPLQKLETKVNKIVKETIARKVSNRITIKGKTLFKYSSENIEYTKWRYFETQKIDLVEVYFSVRIVLNHKNIALLNSKPINPPIGAKVIIDLFRKINNTKLDFIEIGSELNKIQGKKLFITRELYDTILSINKEEGNNKRNQFNSRIAPLLNSAFKLKITVPDIERNYKLLLEEIIANGELTQEDLASLSEKLDSGSTNQIVIKQQVNKQVKWLIDTIEELLEDTKLTTPKVKTFGHQKFGYTKASVTGPEQFIEKILSEYGQYTLFGVPALLNTNKYVVSDKVSSRSQFDIILITHLGDIEVVELKRTDETILDYDSGRGKFYPSKSLSIAVAQAERYISAVNKDNDEEYKIKGKKIRDYINEEVGETLYIESVRPTALILIGSWKTLTKSYDKLSLEKKRSITRQEYDEDGIRAYREIKNSYRNIKILNYSELLEHARTRLEISKDT